uniref:(northern house mosquito) hypothetical protein n=1 Tax=Culex pipiens TaxID=7175 RepID=A0A8D8KXY2_CULPI
MPGSVGALEQPPLSQSGAQLYGGCEQVGAIDTEVVSCYCLFVQQTGQDQRVFREAGSGAGIAKRVEGVVLLSLLQKPRGALRVRRVLHQAVAGHAANFAAQLPLHDLPVHAPADHFQGGSRKQSATEAAGRKRPAPRQTAIHPAPAVRFRRRILAPITTVHTGRQDPLLATHLR